MENRDWQKTYMRMVNIAEGINKSRRKKLSKMCEEAGLGNCSLNYLHSCMLSYNNGNPWSNINYDIAQKAYHLYNSGWLYAASEIVDRWVKKH